MLANNGRYEEALACFEKAIKVQPHDYAAWVFHGVVLLHLNRYQEAVTSCNKALEIQPTDPQALIFRGAALHRLGRYAEAYDSYNQALGNSDPSGWRKMVSKLMAWVMGNR